MKRNRIVIRMQTKPWGIELFLHTPGIQHAQKVYMAPDQWLILDKVLTAGIASLPEDERGLVTMEVEAP